MAIVIALYNENYEWIIDIHKRYPNHKLYIYVKSNIEINLPFATVERLPNVGREAHTYLYHIVKHYDSLEEQTVFTQGNYRDHIDDEFFYSLVETIGEFKASRYYEGLSDPSGKISTINHTVTDSGLNMKQWWDTIVKAPFPSIFGTTWGAIFTVPKTLIKNKPLTFWERNLNSGISKHNNPEEAHFYERTWGTILKNV